MDNFSNKYLYDILLAINSIETYFGDKKIFTEYENNDMLQKAVERQIEIIGEAVSKLLKQKPDLQITNARRIIDTRNYVIHGYDKVSNVIIWGIVINHLPKLKTEIENLLKE